MGSPRRRNSMNFPMVFGGFGGFPAQPTFGSPRASARPSQPPVVSSSSDYPGDFRLVTPNTMMALIKKKYGSSVAPKPKSLESPLCADIVTTNAKTMATFGE